MESGAPTVVQAEAVCLNERSMTEKTTWPQLARLLEIIARLRAPDGCPWDREQTEQSMTPCLLEEAYEAVDAVRSGDAADSCEELGDVLMNVFMIARIAEEAGRYDVEQVAAGIADKLVRRHPHVFGDVEARDSDEVLANWEAIKRTEKADQPARGALAGIPVALPGLLRATRVGEKAARKGFDWPNPEGPRAKLDEELTELDAALGSGDRTAAEHELGDVLFSVVNVARHAGLDAETALRAAVDRFTARFGFVEETLGERMGEAGLDELEEAWQRAKSEGR